MENPHDQALGLFQSNIRGQDFASRDSGCKGKGKCLSYWVLAKKKNYTSQQVSWVPQYPSQKGNANKPSATAGSYMPWDSDDNNDILFNNICPMIGTQHNCLYNISTKD